MKNILNVIIFIIIAILVFIIVSQKIIYSFTQFLTNLFGFETSVDGVPNIYGLILHGLVLALLLTVAGHFFLME